MGSEGDTLLPSNRSHNNNKNKWLLAGGMFAVIVVLAVVAVVATTSKAAPLNPNNSDFDALYEEKSLRLMAPSYTTQLAMAVGSPASPALAVTSSSSSSSSSSKTVCDDGGYSKRTLKKAYELPFASLFTDTKGQKKYEASDVIIVDDLTYAVCDNSWAISRFDTKLEPFLSTNIQLGDPSREKEDSGYEAIFHEPKENDFYVVRESVQLGDATYHAVIEQLEVGEVDYKVSQVCASEYEFEGDSKGFEGAISVRDLNDGMVIIGLCEGNYCSQERKSERGNGRVVAMRRVVYDDGSCRWDTIREIKIPSSANFKDYSAITMDERGRVAITSQEDSQLWVGQLVGMSAEGLWDVDNMEFDLDVSKIYDFPKNDNCETIYCNIEGVHWINEEMIMAVSDKMKSKGKQDFVCFDKDQSVHVFVMP